MGGLAILRRNPRHAAGLTCGQRVEGGLLNVTFPTWSPSVLADMQDYAPRSRQLEGNGLLFVPDGAAGRIPAVVVLEGAGGLDRPGRSSYGEKLQAQGFVALVLDSAGPRRGKVTETTQLADAFA